MLAGRRTDFNPGYVIGNSSIIVDRKDGSIHVTGTSHPLEYYLQAYERDGKLPPRPTTWQRASKVS
jgi:hypothetical protein